MLAALAAETLFSLPPETRTLLYYFDTLVCVVFLGDFFANLVRAQNKLAYLKWGWLDLVSSIPTVQALRWGRAARVVRVVRVLRALRGAKTIFGFLFANRASGTLTSVAMVSFSLVVFSSIAILNVERNGGNITTAEEALWWSFATITTVGYGDFYPVSTAGRLIASLLMTAGVGFFGALTAYVASRFLERPEEQLDPPSKAVLTEVRELRAEVQRLAGRLERDG